MNQWNTLVPIYGKIILCFKTFCNLQIFEFLVKSQRGQSHKIRLKIIKTPLLCCSSISISNTVTQDYKDLADCRCGLMVSKNKCIINGKSYMAVVNRFVKLNVLVLLPILISCFESIIATTINLCYDHINQTITQINYWKNMITQ